MIRQRLAAVSIDLDDVTCYTNIHGLKEPAEKQRHQIYRRAIPRFEEMLSDLDVKATFFVIGKDLAVPYKSAMIRRLHAAGHEIANHTANHPYNLTKLEKQEMEREVVLGADAIAECTGVEPVGFRAPGYTMTDSLLRLLDDLGTRYDSSVFPCPWYWAAKAAAVGWIHVRGRTSHSVVDRPSVLCASAEPYRVGHRLWRKGSGILELPIGVTSSLSGRLPYIGTSLVLAGSSGSKILTRLISGRGFVNLELHGIDLSDRKADDLDFLAPHQPDLRRSAADKEVALRTAISQLKRSGFRFVTLREAASIYADE